MRYKLNVHYIRRGDAEAAIVIYIYIYTYSEDLPAAENSISERILAGADDGWKRFIPPYTLWAAYSSAHHAIIASERTGACGFYYFILWKINIKRISYINFAAVVIAAV